jgi:hypothetical protein
MVLPRRAHGRAGGRKGVRAYVALTPSEIAVLAAGFAAADRGYPGAGRLIVELQLGPLGIARLFSFSLARDGGRSCALILLASATARRHACPEGWNGSLERGLAEQALKPRNLSLWQGGRPQRLVAERTTWNNIARAAAASVTRHWGEITQSRG